MGETHRGWTLQMVEEQLVFFELSLCPLLIATWPASPPPKCEDENEMRTRWKHGEGGWFCHYASSRPQSCSEEGKEMTKGGIRG